MNIPRNFSVLAFVSLLALACGGEDTYADQHIDAIEADCAQTAVCDPVFSVRVDAIDECIRDTSAKLNIGSETFRMSYLMRNSRCAQYVGCQYFDCARDSMLYSVTNQAQLSYECQQATLCKIQSGQPAMTNENDLCFAALATKLDFAPIAERAGWEQRFTRCMTQQSCAYVSCQ